MARNRIIYGILWVLSLVGISFFGGPVSYGIFTLLTLIPVISLLYLLFVSSFFRIYQEIDGKNLAADHTTPYYFILKNEFPFGFAGIRVRFFSDFSEILDLDDGVEYELQPKTGIKKQTGVLCKYRGEYEVGIKSIEVTDFFRLFRIRFKNKETLRVIVRPNIVELTALRKADPAKIMRKESNLRPSQADVLVRKYEPGDDIRYMNWKVSAKSGDLKVRNMIGEEREGIGLILNTVRIGESPEEYLPTENKMLETAIALGFYFTKNNTPVSAYLADVKKQTLHASSTAHFQALYERFSNVEFRADTEEAKLLGAVMSNPEIYKNRVVFLITGKWTEASAALVSKLHGNNVSVVVYLVENPEEEPAKHPGRDVPSVPNVQFLRIPADAKLEEVM